MIIGKIRWKNFLSYGNNWTEMSMNQNKIIGITGKNGSGKSVIIDVIYFGITGKLFRTKVKKSQITNSRNKKNCLVEIDISNKQDKYMIRRGIKPDIFEILKNDKPIDEESSVKDFQTILEQIFGFNPKSVKNTIFMSSMDYKPFIRSTTSEKREYIEDILNLQIFGNMLDTVKIDLSLLKNEIQEKLSELSLIETEINTIMEMNKKITLENELNKKEIKETISAVALKIDNLKKQLTKNKELYNIHLEKYNKRDIKFKSGISENNDKQLAITRIIDDNNSLKRRGLSDIKKENIIKTFFDNNQSCNTCKQEINEEHKKNILSDIHDRICIIEKKIKIFDLKNTKYLDKISKLNIIKNKIENFGQKNDLYYSENVDVFKKKIREIESDISINNTIIQTKEKDLNKEVGTIKDITNKEANKNKIDKQLLELNRKKEIIEMSKKLLSDGGIKSYIINKYIPLLNKYTNEFLDLMGASYRLKFDENFQEQIVLRGYEKLSYHNFSSGEKQRCDLALLFSFLRIAKMKNSFDSNILILDEIIDASMDEVGLNGVMNIIKYFKKNENKTILIISHRHNIKSKLDVTYIAEKKIFSELTKEQK
jgi:DNA repair exonuclease SbcCD ATPase subunit